MQRDLTACSTAAALTATRREDRINNDFQNFRNAADRFKDSAGDNNDLNRSAD